MPAISKYCYVMSIGFQNTFVYRWNFLLRTLFGMVPLMGTYFLWRAIFQGGDAQMAGYDFSKMISYFLIMTVLDSLTSPTEDDFQIAGEIREGLINQFLLKPVDYLKYRLALFWSYRLIYTGVTIIPMLLLIWFMRRYLLLPHMGWTWVMVAASAFMSAMLQFLMAFCSALMAFWILEVSAPIFLIFSLEYLAGGHLFPLDLLPLPIYGAMMMTPFPYEYWFPLGLYMETFSAHEIALGFLMQIFWCVFFWFLARRIWSRGILRYTAVGG